jgi:hypothetical protein
LFVSPFLKKAGAQVSSVLCRGPRIVYLNATKDAVVSGEWLKIRWSRNGVTSFI